MNILIPMAGEGRRFHDNGYVKPKPLLDMHGKPMVERVINNLWHESARFIFVVRRDHCEDSGLAEVILNRLPSATIIPVNPPTEGPLASCMLASNIINKDKPLIVTNCDQITEDWDLLKFLGYAIENKLDGLLGTFDSQHPKNSYARLDDFGYVTEVKEKSVISQHATNGIHLWSSGRLFINSCCEMVGRQDKTNGEYYVAPSYNYMIKAGLRVGVYKFKKHFPIGTPQDYEHYLERMSNGSR